ncbi:MAG: uroporphyrinogen decarboxylase family protein, partial [Phycisphaerae bacterium]|nr:uroporphyrinogen decarboxylase family protein [Phycisphaerae bacterium]
NRMLHCGIGIRIACCIQYKVVQVAVTRAPGNCTGIQVKHIDGIADRILATMEILFDRFEFDGIAVSDDYGTQKAMLMSPATWRKFVRPLLGEIYALAKAHGRTMLHHSCGNIRPIIGDMIDLGLDILHPIQPEAMDIYELKREFGKDLTFNGGLRTQDLLPSGTPEEVREEVRLLKREMGRGGGYILEPGIILQADVPLENIVAMIDETRKTD